MYQKYIKRLLDIICALAAITVFSPIYLILIILGAIFMNGNPFFVQLRPGKDEKIFKMIKFRTMDLRKDKFGKLLPDEERLNKYGQFIRKTSLDELPEAINILIGDMSVIGPRPQLVRDMVFMTPEQRKRHSVRPGLSGLAQVNGRNTISWEDKFKYDLEYINSGITFANDVKIIIRTLLKVVRIEEVVRAGTATDTDFGDWLLEKGSISKQEYDKKQKEAEQILAVR